MTEEIKNEFEDIAPDEESAPAQEFSNTDESLIDSNPAGQSYDWNSAPTGTQAPPRQDMDGKEVVIKSAEIILPPKEREWTVPKKEGSNARYKSCSFYLNYDFEGQREYFSGVKVFKTANGGYSHPTISKSGPRPSQATSLMTLYAEYKEKDLNDVNLKEFMAFLNSQPKVQIKTHEVQNPDTGELVKKNLVGKFL